jgi:hypothetical protein
MADIQNVPAVPDEATTAEDPTELPLADLDNVAGGEKYTEFVYTFS